MFPNQLLPHTSDDIQPKDTLGTSIYLNGLFNKVHITKGGSTVVIVNKVVDAEHGTLRFYSIIVNSFYAKLKITIKTSLIPEKTPLCPRNYPELKNLVQNFRDVQ